MDMMSTSSSAQFYCYALLDQRKQGKFSYSGIDVCFLYEPFYIGKGSKNRVVKHFKENRKFCANEMKWSKIKVIQNALQEDPLYMILEGGLTEQDALDREVWLINTIGRKNTGTGPLLNMEAGGANPPKFNDFDEDKKERIRQKFREKKQSPETRQKRADSNRGKKRTNEFRQQLSTMRTGSGNPMFGKKLTDEQRKNRSQAMLNNSMSKVTYQYDMSGLLMAEWPSMGEIERQLGFSRSKICACCNGKKQQAYGFIWTNELRDPTS